MAGEKTPPPFLASVRHDVLRTLADKRHVIDRAVTERVQAGLDPEKVKLDGKGGGLDGAGSLVGIAGHPGDEVAFVPLCGAYQPGWPPINHPKGKEGKEGKEAKDGKEGKDAKDGKEGKESKDAKEDESWKIGGDETTNPFTRVGEEKVLPWESFEAISKAHPERIQALLQRNVIF
jgi:hypothetical protein